MRRVVMGLGFVALLVGACGGGSSGEPQGEQLLFARTMSNVGGTQLPGVSTYSVAFGVESSPGSMSYPEVFEDDVLTPASVDTTIISAGDDDIEIPQLVALLTNGVDDVMRIRLNCDITCSSISEQPESLYTWAVRRSGPDLVGYTITRFELHVLEMRFEVPGTDPNGDGNWQDRTAEVRIEIYGIR